MCSASAAQTLLTWYDRHARRLPWRVSPRNRKLGEVPDPYRIWLSEVMLQQTTVAAVKDYFEKFTLAWPSVEDLAAAPEEDVMKAWAGLGYYSRARNLKKCADAVAAEFQGRFPDTEEDLLTLPGIGPYTAAAIATIAFDRHAAVVDGNVERVLSRFFQIETPLPDAKPVIRARMADLTPQIRPGDFAQAVMDLGATICTPRRPACALCPWMTACQAHSSGMVETLPRKAPKKEKPTRYGAAFVAVDKETGAVLLRRRPPSGLLGGMTEVPGSDWSEAFDRADAVSGAPFPAAWTRQTAEVRHTFTHFHLRLDIFRADLEASGTPGLKGAWWSLPDMLDGEALPTVMRKALAAALEQGSGKSGS
ncbi:A/G-specific adenine glycosylase [Roseibium marinum]|uniref:Adenine DNA glycosylase n=1 Tax=Roseibium marinum TaxID=281252 RepID=A0A2S3V4D4_9HYPH|nr:A/G-specific adenine glycosylase [Roseibium marinum]POF34750.1 A/G-specific adenine glycosylase [Roseibium marinum]